jgi:glycerophosphoryl diester phosphodiesterase
VIRCRKTVILTLFWAACSSDPAEEPGSASDVVEETIATGDTTTDLSADVDDSADETSTDLSEEPEPVFGDHFLESDHFMNIAHRGGRRLAPENTLVAFQNAVDLGVDVLELDVHSTSDGVIVVLHDQSVDRTTDGSGQIHGMTFEALRELDAAYHFSMDGGETYPYRGEGVLVPTLAEVLGSWPEHYYAVEIKQSAPSIVDEVLAVLEETETLEQVIIASTSDVTLANLRAQNPAVFTSFSAGEIFEFVYVTDDTEADYVPPGDFLHVPPAQGIVDIITPERVARAHRLGLRIHAWTINDPEEMEALIELGVDGIMTDDPATLGEIIASMD